MEKIGTEKEKEMRKGKVGEELEGRKWNWKETGNEQKEKGEEELEVEKNTGEKDNKNL